MVSKVIEVTKSGSNNICKLVVKFDSSSNISVMNTRQFENRLFKDFTPNIFSSGLVFKENGVELVEICSFKHPVFNTDIVIVYNATTKELFAIPNVTLNLDGNEITTLKVKGLYIGTPVSDLTSVQEYMSINQKHQCAEVSKIDLDITKLDELKSSLKLSLFNISGTIQGVSMDYYIIPASEVYYRIYPVIGLSFTMPVDMIKSETISAGILTDFSYSETKLNMNHYTKKEFIESNITFLTI